MAAPAPSPSRTHRRLRRAALAAWAGWAGAVLVLWTQYHLGVYDTVGWLWLPFLAVLLVAGVAALVGGVLRAARGPRRRNALGWAVIGFAPVVVAALHAAYMFVSQGNRNLPDAQAHKVGRMAAVTLFKAEARLRYPHRVETDRLVMYHTDRVTDPAADVAAMDAHLARLEGVLGRTQRARIHWVRGGALGQHAMCVHSVALGSNAGPAGVLDRHELAHAFLYQFSDRGGEPPMLLLEGWAMAVDGHPEPLATDAVRARRQVAAWRGTPDALQSVLAPDLYHVGVGQAYEMGGALADFLLRRYGADRLLEFYNGVRPASLDADCRRVFGLGFDELEREFWAEVEPAAAREQAVGRVRGWAAMLDQRPVAPPAGDRPRRVARLLRAFTPDEAVDLLRGKQPARLPALAAEVGLPVADCERELSGVTWQATVGMGDPPRGY